MKLGLLTSVGPRDSRNRHGYLMNEALVYIGLVFVILGAGYAALYRCIDQSVVLRRNADDIASALHAGERWRADVRLSHQQVDATTDETGQQVFRLQGAQHLIEYKFVENAVRRRVDSGVWSTVLDHVQFSGISSEKRGEITAWRWELELLPRAKGSVAASRIHPLFTFLAIAERNPSP